VVRYGTGGLFRPRRTYQSERLLMDHSPPLAILTNEAFGLELHPHMLRHACGFALANKGHDTRALQAYLGHRNIQHTVRYTELSPDRFKNFWR
jgi:integrase